MAYVKAYKNAKYKYKARINAKNNSVLGDVSTGGIDGNGISPMMPGSVEGNALHVTLMTLKTYNKYIAGRFGSTARGNVPFTKLMNAATDPNSPFKCP